MIRRPARPATGMTTAFLAAAVPALAATVPALAAAVPALLGAQEARPSFAQPAPSPDGSEIAFVTGGDIWVVPAAGGTAHLLVGHEADESRPLYAPDGSALAFVSDRAGDDDIWILSFADGSVRRLTWGDGAEELDAWSPDGRWIYFADGTGDPGGHPDVWRVAASGGTPQRVAGDVYAPEFHAAVAPDGSTLAVAGRARMAQGQWWRHGSSHIDESEIWVVRPGDPPTYRRLSEEGSKNVWPLWTEGGRSVTYMSDRSGAENLWRQPVEGGEARRMTGFDDGRLLFPTLSADGSTLAFERDFGVWTLPAAGGTPRRLAITLRGATAQEAVEHESLGRFSEMALSPDGRKVALVARGEVFAASATDGGAATRVTTTPAAESGVTWAPDSRRIAYASLRDGQPALWVHDVASGEERRLTDPSAPSHTPRFSPDGKEIAFVRDGREVRIVDVASGRERTVARAQLDRYPFAGGESLAWSPDGKWLAFFAGDERSFTNVWVASADGATARPVSRLANSFAGSLAWAPDGRSLYFDTQHRTQEGQVARVDLVPRTPRFREDRFLDLFERPDPEREPDETVPAPADRDDADAARDSVTRIDFDGIHRRLSLLPVGVDAGVLALSPDGKTLVFTASAEGQQNLYAFSVDPDEDGPTVTRQLTSTPGGKSAPRFTPDGREVVFLDRGQLRRVPLDGGNVRTVAHTADLTVDFDAEKEAVFDEGWSYLNDHFYDPDFHGADWDAVRRTFAPRIRAAHTRAEFSRLMNLMVGELDASHLGHRVQGRSGTDSGYLGLEFERAAWEESGRLVISRVIPLGPADVAGGVGPGDLLVEVDGTPVAAGMDLRRVLDGSVGHKVVLGVAGAPGAAARRVEVQPVSSGQLRQLAYRAWVEDKRAYVDRISGGRLGYVHMPDMGWGSYQQLLVDLDAGNHGKEGVVIDIRSNNGGFVNAYALDVFSRQGYLTMETRGYPEATARSMLGQRALEHPTALVVDRNTLSDGEDFTEGYRALDLGPVVGEPTAGWIIFTWNLGLVDGSTLRMPRSRIRGADGQDMERSPRPVDIEVDRPLGESYTDHDAQLDAAVRALLQR